MKKWLRAIINFFRFKNENEALVAGFAGSGAFDGMHEAVEILRKERKRRKDSSSSRNA